MYLKVLMLNLYHKVFKSKIYSFCLEWYFGRNKVLSWFVHQIKIQKYLYIYRYCRNTSKWLLILLLLYWVFAKLLFANKGLSQRPFISSLFAPFLKQSLKDKQVFRPTWPNLCSFFRQNMFNNAVKRSLTISYPKKGNQSLNYSWLKVYKDPNEWKASL